MNGCIRSSGETTEQGSLTARKGADGSRLQARTGSTDMLIITGDTHNTYDGDRLFREDSPVLKHGLSKNDYLLIAGDFGYVWLGDERDDPELDRLASLPVTVLFIDGNHENFTALESYETREWHGGKARYIRDSVIHLMRGEIYEIAGYSVFTFGGAYSVDKLFREEGLSWWPQELPSQEEYDHARENLQKHGNAVDLIVTHEVPTSLLKILYERAKGYDLTHFLEELDQTVTFEHWYCGHHHQEIEFDPKYTLLYTNYVCLENNTGRPEEVNGNDPEADNG